MGPIFKDGKQHENEEIISYGDYKPYGWHKHVEGGDSSNYPEHSRRILDVKEGKPRGVEHFARLLGDDLSEIDGFAIAVVPSHDPNSHTSGLRQIAAKLATGKRTDASGCLIRTAKINKLAHGGDRNIDIHLQTIRVDNPEKIRGRHVLLIDDVTKSGNSLRASSRLLYEAGAKFVQCVALGRTY